ncbi:isochorismatase family cysteine hydrolase [Mycolicibacterium arenosum]|uniref:Cysteine hydrolase n=1 Tax=Mycolicibacterium arenosum TaxID=2952157 RepID=A0ABT1M0S2_9MYCO|nr:isochorismatase family cysteine hydrolase [Mycolicibacterium sp. CAU 1645]MCP9272746.1 cysteine hydrolase [Mycolicibacterium sp. CAU 1645]
MHDIDIPQWVVERVIAKRGAEHVLTDLDPAKTALVVIDMQNAFMKPEVAFAVIKTAPEIVPNVNRLAAATRSAGATVVWIQMTYSDTETVDWSAFYQLTTPEIGDRRREALTRGSEGHHIWAELDVLEGDPVIEKTKFSALVQGSSELDTFLRDRGIDTLIITGVITDVCCEATSRDGMMLNYRVILVSDANAADTDADHNNALCAVYTTFGDVMPTDMVVGLLGG